MTDCLLCRPADAERELGRVEVWRDELWRVAVALTGPVAGFGHLEPHRHIANVIDLDGPEAATFGPVLARVCRELRAATGADLVYANVFGERIAHLHVNLSPHRAGDALLGGPGMIRPGTPDLPTEHLAQTAEAVRDRLSG